MVVQALDQVGDAFRSYFDDLALIEQVHHPVQQLEGMSI